MQLELSATERRALINALEVYRRVKGAEGKLESQKHKNADERNACQGNYDRLIGVIVGLKDKVAVLK